MLRNHEGQLLNKYFHFHCGSNTIGDVSYLIQLAMFLKFTILASVMKGILVIPHSNASCERAFSVVRKNKTEFRPNLGVETLEAILIEKLSQKKCCYQRDYPSSTVKKAKEATYKALRGSKDTGGEPSTSSQ